MKTRFSEIPLTRGEKPLKAPVFLHLANHRGHSPLYPGEQHLTQHQGYLPARHSNFRSEGPHSLRFSHSFLRVLLRSLSTTTLSLPGPTLRPPSCLATPTFHGVVAWVALVIQHDGEGAGGGQVSWYVSVECHGPHSSERPTQAMAPGHSQSEALGSSLSTTLGTVSWATTCTHLVSILPNTI